MLPLQLRKMCEKRDVSAYLRRRKCFVYLRRTCSSKSEPYLLNNEEMNLGQDRPLWCCAFPGEISQTSSLLLEEWKRGQLRGDNEHPFLCVSVCVCVCVSVCWYAWLALFMKIYCTSNDPTQNFTPLTIKIHHELLNCSSLFKAVPRDIQ